jgi:hypothetical protein
MIITQQVILDQNNSETKVGEKIDSHKMISASFQLVSQDSDVSGEMMIEGSNQMVEGDRESFAPTEWSFLAATSISNGKANILTIPNLCCQFIRVIFSPSKVGNSSTKVTMNSVSEA